LLADFGRAYEVDQQNVRTLKGNERRLARLQEAIAAWRAKLAAASAEFEREQQRLKDEREMVAEHFHRLKSRMARLREIQRQRLLDMTKASTDAIKALDAKLETAEKILRSSALNERLLTEEETVLGFKTLDEAVPVPGSQLPDEAESAIAAAATATTPRRAPEYSTYAMAKSGDVVDEAGLLENFFKRYNRALADTEALEREAEQLRKENEDLAAILNECEAGETLTDGASAAALGTLLVVNQRMAPRISIVAASSADQAAGGSRVVLMESTAATTSTATKTT
jgi:DNA repair exonuclease SbcCD ATPase subunit